MIRHLLRLAWNRKRANALLLLEIFVSFLVLFGVTAMAARLVSAWRHPLGFEWRHVWNLAIETHVTGDDEWTAEDAARFGRLLREIDSVDGVEAAAGILSTPYTFSESTSGFDFGGRIVKTEVNEVTDDLAGALSVPLVAGRWFGPQDDRENWWPIVIDRDFAADAWPGEDPIGKTFESDGHDFTVVGEVEEFRRAGEFAPAGNMMFKRVRVDSASSRPPHNIVIRVAPGSGAGLEQRILDHARAVVPDWSFRVDTLEALREGSFRLRVAPLVAAGIVGAFLMFMVSLGLVGVLWQNVTRRTKEIGLRRALGSSRGAIFRQILLEVGVITFLGVAGGVALVCQVPLVDGLGVFDGPTTTTGVFAALAIMFALTLSSGLYPAWLASRTEPATALHDE